jgi:hypothetical protein
MPFNIRVSDNLVVIQRIGDFIGYCAETLDESIRYPLGLSRVLENQHCVGWMLPGQHR